MKYAYPQSASSAVDAIRRNDEKFDIASQEQKLDTQQEVASIGDTVPLMFCKRFDAGSGYGTIGGVWISPYLLQVGLDGKQVSLMYLLSQGKLSGVNTDDVYWGRKYLTDVDSGAVACTGYATVPSCINLSYQPGGIVSWTENLTQPGPSGSGNFTTPKNTTSIKLFFDAEIYQEASAKVYGGYSGTFAVEKWRTTPHPKNKGDGSFGPYSGLDTGYPSFDYNSLQFLTPKNNTEYSPNGYNTNPQTRWTFSFADLHKFVEWYLYGKVTYDYEVLDIQSDQIVKKGNVTVYDSRYNETSLNITGLPAGQYRVTLKNEKTYNTRQYDRYTITYNDPGGVPDNVEKEWKKTSESNTKIIWPTSGYESETWDAFPLNKNIASSAICTVTNTIEYPDLPDGGSSNTAALTDLTLLGVKGDVTVLRPSQSIDYFTQTHLFVSNGIQVRRLLDGGTSSSSDYADLVYYLMKQSTVIADDQIDVDSLKAAIKCNRYYRLYYNGILQTTQNLAEWITRTAPYFLMIPTQLDGRYGFAPVSPLDASGKLSTSTIYPKLTLTRDDIVDGSYKRRYIASRDRRPICLIMVYRVQPDGNLGTTSTVEVRYSGSASSGPFEQHDLSEFCVHPKAAVTVAKCILAKRRYTTHECEMTVDRSGKNLNPGDIVRVTMKTTTSDGTGLNDSHLYQIDTVTEGLEGSVNLSMTHFPVDGKGRSMVAMEVASNTKVTVA